MKSENLYIDGIDAYLNWGIYIVKGGYNELVAMPPLKEPPRNDWHEEDGSEVDLEQPALNAKQVAISFAVTGERYSLFFDKISDGAYHQFYFAAIGRTYRLRLVSNTKWDNPMKLGIITLKFSDDFPMSDYQYQPPYSTINQGGGYRLDGKDISEYGVKVLKGTITELTKLPSVKLNLLTQSKFSDGVNYDNSKVTFKSKDVKINCLIRAENLAELWNNYDALLHDLVMPRERELYCDELAHTFLGYYKNCKVSNFSPQDAWLEFTLTLSVTGNLRIDMSSVLATETFDIIYTEDKESAIDLTN